jgi:hypothetical protein
MTLARRVAAIETSLSPTQLILRWLADAHSYGSVERYVASLLERDPPEDPLDRLAREAAHGAQAAMRGKRPEVAAEAIRSALRETVFRFGLALRINETAHELLEREELIAALFAAQLAMLLGEAPDKDVAGDSHVRRLELCRRLTLLRVDELLASHEARTSVEARYLDGRPALFPEEATRFEKQLRSSQEIAVSAVRAAELDGVEPSSPQDPDTLKVRVDQLVADLVEPARSETLDKLGEGRQALAIAAAWVRSKLRNKPTAM